MKISKWPFFVAKIWQTTSTDQQIRKGGSQKNTRKLRMQGGRYETKKDGKGGRARDKNCSLEESFTHFMTRKRKKMLSNPEFEYHGTVYPSLKVCCEELGINKSSVISRSHRAGCSLQEAVEYYVSQQERRTLD
jgi:hypothetical protein